MRMSLAEFLERMDKDPFDPELVKLVENGFNVVSPTPDARKEEPCNS